MSHYIDIRTAAGIKPASQAEAQAILDRAGHDVEVRTAPWNINTTGFTNADILEAMEATKMAQDMPKMEFLYVNVDEKGNRSLVFAARPSLPPPLPLDFTSRGSERLYP